VIQHWLEPVQRKNWPGLDWVNDSYEKTIRNLEINKIQYITVFDENFPRQLKKIFDPPLLFFYKGNVDFLFEKSIAVVGTRKATNYGEDICRKLVKALAAQRFTVVSGLASGIDAYAHRAALEASGKCIGVVGHGFDYCFPTSNRRLFRDVLEHGGALISEYLPFEPPQSGFFPARNRIVAGLTKGTLVIEAAEKSGSLITAQLAFSEGRDVYAVPADVNRPQSQGCNELIRRNVAKLVTSAQDILRDYGFVAPEQQSGDLDALLSVVSPAMRPILEQVVFRRLTSEEISEMFPGDVSQLLEDLTMLEIQGYIARDGHNRWYIK
jgi:DNA processing protein